MMNSHNKADITTNKENMPKIDSGKVKLWWAVTTFALLLTVIFAIAMVALSDYLNGLESVIILITTLPLFYVLLRVRQLHRPGIVKGMMISFIYFCAGIVAMTADVGSTPIPLMFVISVLGWFTGSLNLVKARFPPPPKDKNKKNRK